MDRQQFNSCISQGMKGKHYTADQRKLEFCILAKKCSGKATSDEQARSICSQPKPEKPEGTGKKRRGKKSECPAFDPATLIPRCETQLGKMVSSGELDANTDISGICQLILG